MVKYLWLWVPMVFIAIANGAVRQFCYGRCLSELPAHQLSTLTGLLLFGIYIFCVIRLFPPVTGSQAVSVGLLWLGLTVAFEFLFGHYVAGHAWIAAVGAYMTESFEDDIFNTGVTVDHGTQGHVNPALEKWQDALNFDSNGSFTVWNFDPRMRAFGGTWTLGGPGGSGNYLEITLEEFSNTPVAYISSYYNNEFWGFVCDVAFSKVKLTGGSADNQQSYDLDDMVYGPAPLPGALVLFGTGLLALFGRRKS